MSASLVGSEMCIRDRHPALLSGVETARPDPPNERLLRARPSRVLCVHSGVRGWQPPWRGAQDAA
eukprot:4478777-Alexandrium_andersonii.AAC.1